MMKMTKKDLLALGIKVIENEDLYVPTMKEVYNDIYGDMWAERIWERNVTNRNIDDFSTDFLRQLFDYEVLGYTVVITPNRKVAFLNREYYIMDEDEIATLALIHLNEVQAMPNTKVNFVVVTGL